MVLARKHSRIKTMDGVSSGGSAGTADREWRKSWRSLLSQVREPQIQDFLILWVDRSESDSHPRVGPRIRYSSYRNEVHTTMRDLQSDLGALRERRHGFDKASQQIQVLDMCRKVLLRL